MVIHLSVLLTALMQFNFVSGPNILQPHLVCCNLLKLACVFLARCLEGFLILPRPATGGAYQFFVASCPGLARIPLLTLGADFLRKTLQPIAHVRGDALLDLCDPRPLRAAQRGEFLDTAGLARPLLTQQGDPFVQQFEFESCKVRAQRLTAGTQLLERIRQFAMAVAVGYQRGQQLDLPLGLEYRLMDTVWWNNSRACSFSIPKRRRNQAP